MGLDMYLSLARYSAPGWNNELYERLAAHTQHLWPVDQPEGIIITAKVAYWRKANAIHQWFVDNCQDGVDDCRTSYVSPEQLKELRDLCADLLKDRNPERAKDELPPQSGFFFGGTEIDDWYWNDLELTVSQLTKILNWADVQEDRDFDFEYRSSW